MGWWESGSSFVTSKIPEKSCLVIKTLYVEDTLFVDLMISGCIDPCEVLRGDAAMESRRGEAWIEVI